MHNWCQTGKKMYKKLGAVAFPLDLTPSHPDSAFYDSGFAFDTHPGQHHSQFDSTNSSVTPVLILATWVPF